MNCHLVKRKVFPRSATDCCLTKRRKKKRREQSTQATESSLRLALCSLPLYRAGAAILVKFVTAQGTRLPRHPKIKEITNSTRNIMNRSFAMPADAAAIPPNPKTAATSAIIRNITAQPNIPSPPQRLIVSGDCIARLRSRVVDRWNKRNNLTICSGWKHHLVRSGIKRNEEFFD